tara:strand:+ start:265 stop:909 length:645 start_codon:yes stop_codon:yes gene_type:complete
MSITRLQQARQMYAMGQRVAKTLDGSRPGYRGDDAYGGGTTAGGDRSNSPGDRGDGPATNVDMSHFGDTGDIIQADFTPYNQRPDTITSGFDNYNAQRKAMGLLNFLPGAQIYNIGKTLFQTDQARNLLGLGPTTVAPDLPDRDNGNNNNEGIMNLYTSNMSNNLNEVEDVDTEQEIIPFINRFKLSADSTQAKGVERLIQDQAIANMISRLYT